MTPPIDLEALEAALEKATPGPWVCGRAQQFDRDGKESGPISYFVTAVDVTHGPCEYPIGMVAIMVDPHERNAEAIAALRNAAPALIALARAGQSMRVVVRRESCSLEPDGEALTTALRAYDAATKGGG